MIRSIYTCVQQHLWSSGTSPEKSGKNEKEMMALIFGGKLVNKMKEMIDMSECGSTGGLG